MISPQTKPLAAATRLVLICSGCGRLIDRLERMNLLLAPKCPDCGCRLRRWERAPAGRLARLMAWARLYRWKRAQRHLERKEEFRMEQMKSAIGKWRIDLSILALGLLIGSIVGFDLGMAAKTHAPGRYAVVGGSDAVALDTVTGKLCAVDEPDRQPDGLPVCGK